VDPVVLDIGDDLAAVGRADVVVSSSGRAQLLTAEHLHPGHRLVVDTGFVPLPAGAVGDVHPAARGIPAAITPVPGGVGPVEMAVLAERLLTTLVAPDLAPWRYLGPAAPSVTDVAQTVADQRARARPTGGGAGPSVPGPAAPGRSAPGPTTPGPAPGRRGEPPGPPASGPRRR
jgi:methylenetetrahydrofolate dehydrogenase (NADP+)/methenyltetrahydrofolate cyclohydrolase